MVNNKGFIVVALVTFCLVLTLFRTIPTFSSSVFDYNPWLDINGDGCIDGGDIIQEARTFGTSGDPTRPVTIAGYDWNTTTSTINIPPKQQGTINITTGGYRQVTVGFASHFLAQVETEFLLSKRYAVMDRFDIGLPMPADSMWIEPSVLNLTSDTAPVGTRFNVTVWLNVGIDDVYGYQIALHYNRTQLKGTRANFTDDFMDSPPSGLVRAGPLIDTGPTGNGTVLAFESCQGPVDFIAKPKGGTLMWAEFEIILAPSDDEPLTSSIDISTGYTAGWTWANEPTNLDHIPLSVYDALYVYWAHVYPAPAMDVFFDVYKTYAVIGPVLTIKYSNPNDFAITLLVETYTTA
jgi:hypothetical protein